MSFLLLVIVIGLSIAVWKLLKRSKAAEQKIKQWETRFGGVPLDELQAQVAQYTDKLNALKERVIHEETLEELQSYGLYENVYNFEEAEKYKAEHERIRQKQKDAVKSKTASVCEKKWFVEGSAAKGRKMVNEQLRLMLRAFNGECDATLAKMRHDNINAQIDRIKKSYDAINKLGQSKHCRITQSYVDLKVAELRIVHEYQKKKEEELEEQRRIKEQIREEQKALQEIERERKRAEEEERRYQDALVKAREAVQALTGAKQEKMQQKIRELEERLAEAESNKQRAISRAQMTRSGHIYVISNIGSFGDDVYKIGMTRRLEPLDRVKELGDASVPFGFDVHAMIFSEDAPSLEAELHRTFDRFRVNRINLRREYFRVSLRDIEREVRKRHRAEIHWTVLAEAREYRETLQILEMERKQAA